MINWDYVIFYFYDKKEVKEALPHCGNFYGKEKGCVMEKKKDMHKREIKEKMFFIFNPHITKAIDYFIPMCYGNRSMCSFS